MREVFVWPTVYNVLWQNLNEACFNRVRDQLINQLENKYDSWRERRHPDDETVFVYTLHLADEDKNWHTFEFIVDDTIADMCLIVIDVHYLPSGKRS